MTESQFDAYLAKKCEEIKNEAEVSIKCTVSGDLECYARGGSFREWGTYGFDSQDDLEEAILKIEDVVNECDVNIYHHSSDKVSIEGEFINVKKALDRLSSSIVDTGEFEFEEPSI